MNLFPNLYDKILSPFNYSVVSFIEFLIITNNNKKVKESSAYKPLKIFFCVFGVFLATYTLKLSDEFSFILHKIFRIMCILLISKAFINLFSNKKSFKFFKGISNDNNRILIK